MIDWFPTLVSVVGGEIPNDRIIDGKNILPVLLGEGKRKDDEFAFCQLWATTSLSGR